MYLLAIYFDNARHNGAARFEFKGDDGTIAKWTPVSGGAFNRELLRVMAVACGGVRFLNRLPWDLGLLRGGAGSPLRVECILALHRIGYARPGNRSLVGSAVEVGAGGQVRTVPSDSCRFLPVALPVRAPVLGTGNTTSFVVAYGPTWTAHEGTDDFSFTDPFFRVSRFHSLFLGGAPLTDPVAFLERLHYRAVLKGRYPAQRTLRVLCSLLPRYLGVDTGAWTDKGCDFRQAWEGLSPWQQRAATPVLDMARHMMDAFPLAGEPLNMPGLVLFDRPDRFCTERALPRWLDLLDELVPAMQVVLTLPDRALSTFPQRLAERRLPLPVESSRPARPERPRLSRNDVLLIDVDGSLPNLALMKLSTHFKDKGRRVVLARKAHCVTFPEAVYASCVFSSPSSARRVARLRQYYGTSLVVGGSGVDLHDRLPKAIEKLPADYSLYPELGDRAMGFITRGCPFHCAFCIVPIKEGRVHQVSDLQSLVAGNREKLVLLDDNILAHPKAGEFLEEMARQALKVNFTQTLDIRLLSKAKAKILRRIHCSNLRFTRRTYHFSLNDNRGLEEVRRRYDLMRFSSRDNVEFVCMYGFNTTLLEDVERFRFLRSLPGAYVFVQEYQPIPGGPSPDLTRFFDEDADALIDELVGILFPQNMKSMEKYYRWLSKLYCARFGKLHHRLVDTIFRYNNRDRKGHYIASMLGEGPGRG